VPVEVKAGHAVFHHPLMIHGSGPNASDRPRRGIVVNVMADGTRAAEDLPDVDGVPAWLVGHTEDELAWPVDGAPRGRRLEGRFWPRLDGSPTSDRRALA
jgi:ectoine hydroxylase-related dioxygenase (phytanoyl-CoA dioxygenase family)